MTHPVSTGNDVALRLRDYEVHTLDNGLRLILLEDHELPLVDVIAVIDAGAVLVPPGRDGLARLAMDLLRRGTEKRTARQISDDLDQLGGLYSVAAGHDHAMLSAEFMRKDAEVGLDLIADLLLHPVFPEEEVDKFAALYSDGIRQAKDNPSQVIQRYYEAFLFSGHPYGRPPGGTEQSLLRIERQDLVSFHEKYIRPDRTVLVVAGDIDTDATSAAVADLLGAWQPGEEAIAVAPEPEPVAGRKVLLLDKPDEQQVYFRFGNVGVSLLHPNRSTIDVVRTIVGGRFTSWLNTELRIRRGLTYGAGCAFTPRCSRGPFTIYSYTRTSHAGEALALALEQLQRIHDQGVEDDSLRSAVAFLKGQMPPSLETVDQQAALIAELEFYGIGREHVDTYFQRLDSLSVEEANRVARGVFPLEDLAFVLIGPAAEIAPVAREFGEVERRDLQAPGFYDGQPSLPGE